jgi:hypothetical protein
MKPPDALIEQADDIYSQIQETKKTLRKTKDIGMKEQLTRTIQELLEIYTSLRREAILYEPEEW